MICLQFSKVRFNSKITKFTPICKSLFNITGTLNTDGPIIGAYAELKHSFPQEDVILFSKISGDNNPLHINPEFANKSMFKGPIVHGILVSSLFSTLFGKSISGSIYVSQSLEFKRPIHIGVDIIARMEIIKIDKKRNGLLATCTTKCNLMDGKVAVIGEAKVLIPPTL
jgi:acyl dehydratase